MLESMVRSAGHRETAFAIIAGAEETVRALYERAIIRRFHPGRTARARKTATLPVRIAAQSGRVHFDHRVVLDYGKGKSVDCEFVTAHGGLCYIYDFTHCPLTRTPTEYLQTERIRHVTPTAPRGLFDIVICAYVLNVVTLPERRVVAKTVTRLIKRDGVIIVGVREDAENIVEDWATHEDGYLTPLGTFQIFFRKGGDPRVARLFPQMVVERIGRGTYLVRHPTGASAPKGLEAFLPSSREVETDE